MNRGLNRLVSIATGSAVLPAVRSAVADVVGDVQQAISAILNISGSKGLVYDKAGGTLVNGRSSTATIVDFEGLTKDVKANEIRYSGGRRVENLLQHTEDISMTSYWFPSGGTVTTDTVITTSENGSIRPTSSNSINVTIGQKFVFSFTAQLLVGSGSFRFRESGTCTFSELSSRPFNMLASLNRYSVEYTITGAGSFLPLVQSLSNDFPTFIYTKIQTEEVTGQLNQNPSEYLSSDTVYNSGLAGIACFDTENGNTVTNYVVTEAESAVITPAPTILHEGDGTNYCFPSSTPATQIITLAAGDYTVWLDDTDDAGQIVLTGGATGTANSTDTNGFQFTASGAAVTFTHSGSNNVRWQVEGGDYRTSYIPTTTAVTRAADDISIPLSVGTNFVQEQGAAFARFIAQYDSDTTAKSIVSIFAGLGLIFDSSTINRLSSTDGTNTANRSVTWLAGQEILVTPIWSDGESTLSLNVSLDGGIVWSGWIDATYDGAFTTGTDILLANSNPDSIDFKSAQIYGELEGGTIATAKTWVEANAGSLTNIDVGLGDELGNTLTDEADNQIT